MRVWSDREYGIPREQVVGSTGATRFEMRNGTPVLVKTMDYVFVDDKAGKPSGRGSGDARIHHYRHSAPEPWVLVHQPTPSGSMRMTRIRWCPESW